MKASRSSRSVSAYGRVSGWTGMMKKPSFINFLRADRASTCLHIECRRPSRGEKTNARREAGHQHLGPALADKAANSRRVGGEIAELLQVRLLLLVARRQLEQARRGAAEDVVLGLLRQERQVVD